MKRRKTDPLIFHTQTSTEYWQKRGCLSHTDGKGNDLKLPENVRLYVIASAQHNSPFGSEPAKDDSQFLVNPLPAGDVLRAPDGRHGFMGDKRYSAAAQPLSKREGSHPGAAETRNGFPKIPGVNFAGLHNRQLFLDYGKNILRGKMEIHPPKPIGKGAYKILVPKVDADGNDIAGIRLPAIEVPVGTYTGWNLRPRGLAEGELSGLLGSFIPFAKTKVATAKDRRSAPIARRTLSESSRLRSARQPRRENSSRAKIFVAGRRRENYCGSSEGTNLLREKIIETHSGCASISRLDEYNEASLSATYFCS